jgi:hypothetical protein
MAANANGFTVSGVAGHTSAIYGNAFAGNTGSVYQVNGVMGVSGNAGSGTLVNGVDFFGHGAYNTGGGTITNHYFLYQEASTAATHEYGAFFSAPVGIGTTAPDYNLRVGGAGGALSDNWLYIGGGFGAFSVTSNGASLFPGFNPGAGGFGCLNLIVGNNGTAEATTSTAAFLYVSACAGTPTGVPPLAAVGRVAMRYDTTAHKLWMHDGTVWRGIVLT